MPFCAPNRGFLLTPNYDYIIIYSYIIYISDILYIYILLNVFVVLQVRFSAPGCSRVYIYSLSCACLVLHRVFFLPALYVLPQGQG